MINAGFEDMDDLKIVGININLSILKISKNYLWYNEPLDPILYYFFIFWTIFPDYLSLSIAMYRHFMN